MMVHRDSTLPVFVLALLLATPAWSGTEAPPGLDRLHEAMGRHILVTLHEGPARALQHAGSTPRAYLGRGRYKTSQRVKRMAARLGRTYGLRRVDEWPIQALEVHCVVYEVPARLQLEEIVELLSEDARVESVQQMGFFRVLGRTVESNPSLVYDDPYLELQHALESMQIARAHAWASGDGVSVAVIDTGVDLTHPELQGRIGGAENFVDENAHAFTSDIHGTGVAGVIASSANNGIGIVGVAPAVEILALKACWTQGERDLPAQCSTFTLAKALSFVIARRPEVLNLSLAGPADPLLSRLLVRALDRGIIVISAADPATADRSGFPGGHGRVIVVSSAGGGDAGELSPLRLSAPGEEIFTTLPYGGYDFLSGSSFAAAHVSGLVALLLEEDDRLSPEQVLVLLRETGGNSLEGVNGCRALARLRGAGTCGAAGPQALTAD